MSSKHNQASLLISQGVFNDLKSFREFELRVSSLSDLNSKAQGDAFEIFVEAYLATQPILQCEETWIVGDIPIDIREKLNLPRDAKGIDGVYRSALGTLVPYQVKFRSNRPALGFNEVAPFLGITEKAIDRLLITNCDSIAIDVQNRTGVRSLRGVDFDQLTEHDFNVIENWLKKVPKKRELINPDPYQIEALGNISNHYINNDRGTVVMACGTGKTLVALWAVEQIKSKSILVLLPSLTLLQQTLEEWSIHNSWSKDFSYLCVCSDPSVNLKNDEVEIDPSDVPFRIDTDPEIVRRYLAQDNGKVKVIFSTYHSSQIISQATKGTFDFEFAVFDEAHKTTGSAAGRFAIALHDENIKIKKRLFLTATPKHYDINKRDKDGEFKYVSMDDESVYGSRAHTLLFSDAVAKEIICPYKVVITLINKQQVDDFALKNGITLVEGDAVRAKWVAGQIAVSSAIKHTSASKIITFHNRVRSAREFASDEAQGVNRFIDNYDVFHAHGKQKSSERKDTISKFRHAKKSLITNAKCLTEGVDVPAVDMVAFIEPRHSKIDIAQAVGRAMRKPRGSNKQLGYIVVPLYAKDMSNTSIDESVKTEGFDDVALVLNSLLELDDELTEIIRILKESKGKGNFFNTQRIKGKIELIGPFVGLDELSKSIYQEIVDRLGSSWDEWYGRLIIFVESEGHSLVSSRFVTSDGYKLGGWVDYCRNRKKLGLLSNDRVIKLESLPGWVWDISDDDFNFGIIQLDQFIKENNHCRVPNKYVDKTGFKLGSWIANRRNDFIKKRLNEERINRLENISGWVWSIRESDFEVGLLELQSYIEKYNSCSPPSKFVSENGFLLGQWVRHRRDDFRVGRLRDNQISKLDSLNGWTWNPLEESFNDGLRQLQKFVQINGHSKVIDGFVDSDGFNLGRWVAYQRRSKDIRLNPEKIKILEDLPGWTWDPIADAYNYGLAQLKKYLATNGHCRVPIRFIDNDKFNLGKWVSYIRKSKDVRLSSERIFELESLTGWTWNPFEDKFNFGFERLLNYISVHGNSRVANSYIDSEGFRLGEWVRNRKEDYKNKKLPHERILKLENISDWVWDLADEDFNFGFIQLQIFYEKNKHCKVLGKYVNEIGFKLGSWVTNRSELAPESRIP
jgi:superfamily II DNA or RNA helicase